MPGRQAEGRVVEGGREQARCVGHGGRWQRGGVCRGIWGGVVVGGGGPVRLAWW